MAQDHVFVSYARADKAYAGRLAAHLRTHGVEVWTYATIAFGADWQDTIQERINSCAVFIVVMSPAAEQSAWVRREVLHAQVQRRQIFPLLLSGTPLFAVSNLQYEAVQGGGMPSQRWVDHLRAAAISPAARPV